MEEYRAFKLLAHAALSKFNVHIGTYYGSADNATVSGVDQWWVKVKGMSLPPEGLSAGSPNYTTAIDSMARQLKSHYRAQDELRLQRERAKRSQTFSLAEAEQLSACP